MKIGDKIYCINVSVYSDHISLGFQYQIEELKKREVRIQNDRGKSVWIPNDCFSELEPPKMMEFKIDDEIKDELNDCIEVTITFSNNEKRWLIFMTVEWLKGLLNEHRNFVLGRNLIIVEHLSKRIIEITIEELDSKNKLISESQAY